MKDLIIFTNSYPYGNAYKWLDPELVAFKKYFNKITIIPYSYENNRIPRKIEDGIIVKEPLFSEEPTFSGLKQLLQIFTARLFYYFREFFRERVYTNSYWFKSWAKASLQTEQLLKHKEIRLLQRINDKKNTVLYYYWGNNSSLLVPFLKPLGFGKILVRFHGFDLYKERLGGYQPYRRPLLRALDMAAPISEYGRNYLIKNYPDIAFKSKVMRLGTSHIGLSKASEDGVFRIVSCARVIKLKRIDLIPEALKRLKHRIEWTHIGDGDDMNAVKKAIENLPDNIKINLPGQIPGDQVLKFYKNNPCDLFISVSESEGIPVSIMEALSAGIPVLSTDVGGIREILNEKNGKLVSEDVDAQKLAREIQRFITMDRRDLSAMRRSAYQRYLERCDSAGLAGQLIDELSDE